MTLVEEIDASGPNSDQAAEHAVEALRRGHLLAHPTETVYGIGGPSTERFDRRIAAMKGRAVSPLIRLVADAVAARELFPEARWSEAADSLASAFWPGPLTLVLDDGTEHGVAMRAEAHPVVRRILELWGRALSSSSLNRTDERPACSAEEARAALRGMPKTDVDVTLIVAGALPGPPPSTLVSLRGGEVQVIREGRIPASAVLGLLGREVGT